MPGYADLYWTARFGWSVRAVAANGWFTDWPILGSNGIIRYDFPERIPDKVREVDVPAAFEYLADVMAQPQLLGETPKPGSSMKVPQKYRDRILGK